MELQIGVKVLVKHSNGTYLFIQRTQLLQYQSELAWDIPGGRIEANEPLVAALQREVSEELGVTLVGEPRLIAAQDIFVEAKQLHVVRLTYLLEQDIDGIVLSDEHQKYQWAYSDEAMTLTLDPYLRDVLVTL